MTNADIAARKKAQEKENEAMSESYRSELKNQGDKKKAKESLPKLYDEKAEQDPKSYANQYRVAPVIDANADTESPVPKFAKGAGNQLLFGIPSAIISKTGLPGRAPEQTRADISKLEQDPAYQAGSVTGAVGSGFIPIAGIAGRTFQGVRGGAELAGATDKLNRLQKLIAPIAKAGGVESAAAKTMGGALKTNVANAVAGEGIREAAEGKLDAGKLAQAGLYGVGGTLVGKGVGAGIEKIAGKGATKTISEGAGELLGKDSPRPSKELVEAAKQKLITFGPLNPHLESLTDPTISKIGSSAAQAAAADRWIVNAAKVANKYGVKPDTGETLDHAMDMIGHKYKELDKITQPLVPKIQQTMESEDVIGKVSDIMKNIPTSKSDIMNAVSKNADDILNDIKQAQSPQAMRDAINNHMGIFYGQKGGASDQNVVDYSLKIAKMLRGEMDGIFSEAAKAAGKSDLMNVPKEYGILQDIGKQQLSKQFAGGGGNETVLGQAIGNFVTGASSAKSLIAASIGQTIGRGPAKAFRQYTQNKAGERFSRLVGEGEEVVAPIARGSGIKGLLQSIPEAAAAESAAHGGSGIAAAALEKQRIGEGSETQTAQANEIGVNPESNNIKSRITPLIDKAANLKWEQSYSNLGYGPAGPDNDNYVAFMNQIHKNLSTPDGNDIDPRVVAKLLLPNEVDQKTFSPAYDAYRSIFPNIKMAYQSSKGVPLLAETAGKVPLIGDIANEANLHLSRGMNAISQSTGPKAARDAIISGVKQMATAGGKSPEDAAHTAEQIIVTSSSPAEMEKRLLEYVSIINSPAFTVLKKTGIIP